MAAVTAMIAAAAVTDASMAGGCPGGVSPVLKFRREAPRVVLPRYESGGAAGLDLRAFLDAPVALNPLQRAKIPTGLRVEIPPGYEGQVRPRSGLAFESGLTVLNSPGTIDCDFRGLLEVLLVNLGSEVVSIADGQRIAQLVIAPVCRVSVEEAASLSPTGRGSGGFGSTGV